MLEVVCVCVGSGFCLYFSRVPENSVWFTGHDLHLWCLWNNSRDRARRWIGSRHRGPHTVTKHGQFFGKVRPEQDESGYPSQRGLREGTC